MILFEEIKPNMLERIEDLDRPLEHVLEELMDGDIIVFQKELSGDEEYRLPTSRDYFRDLFYKVKINLHCKLNFTFETDYVFQYFELWEGKRGINHKQGKS